MKQLRYQIVCLPDGTSTQLIDLAHKEKKNNNLMLQITASVGMFVYILIGHL